MPSATHWKIILTKNVKADENMLAIIIKLLQKTVSLASNLKVEAPQQLLDFCMYAVGTMGGIVSRMTKQLIEGVVMPTDRAKAVNIEYDTEIALEGEPEKENLFDGTVPMEVALARAVVLEEKMKVRSFFSVLNFMRFSGGALSGRAIQHGDAVYVFPGVCDVLASRPMCAGNETLGVMGLPEPTEFAPQVKWNEEMVYHQFVVPKPDSAVNIEITPHDPSAQFLVYIRHRVKPQLNAYDLMVNLSTIRSTNGKTACSRTS
ncbi:hypothetical protein HPB47_004078 [Ixodes persulcatus]|uniref:Uncharacterized protein n=1 Tax=Ixodes persulcatus TaxID=34615 RepID=A0AC60PGM4_IXOPE|nr:hypothetical protein HPB47_004078 [Ixodes persulcatus]